MLVPRSYKYSSSPPKDMFDDKTRRRGARRTNDDTPQSPPKPSMNVSERLISPTRSATEPMRIPTKPVDVPTSERQRSSKGAVAPKSRPTSGPRRKSSTPEKHRPDALPPSVAALLAMTSIPRPKPNQFRRRSSSTRNISIDELVNEWKSDESLGRSLASSPSLSILLEDADEAMAQSASLRASQSGQDYLHMRSISSDSIPSLEADDRSLLSTGSPSTPGSLRSRKSSTNLRKEAARSLPTREECTEHPLIPAPDSEEDTFEPSPAPRKSTLTPRPSFKSNLTTSLQALKLAALNSISSLKTTPSNPASSPARPSQTRYAPSSTLSDDTLWSHPYLFPRFSSEIRPDIRGTPTEAQRRYLNPAPLTFEEQEAPFQQALHAPYLAEQCAGEVGEAPTIQMQTYSRGNNSRRARGKRGANSGAGAGSGQASDIGAGMRLREPRENGDFLRVVVMEMNMRREGKLEVGRARIWLPPRKVAEGEVVVPAGKGAVPRRWVGESA